MNFKEQMAIEAGLFLNPDEFGEYVVVDGRQALGAWDEVVQPSPQFFGATMDVMGVNTVERLLFLLPDPDDPIDLPVADQILEIDGERWTVRDAKPEGSIMKLTLYRNES